MMPTSARNPAVWFPAIRTGAGVDVFTENLAQGLVRRGVRAEIAWLPHRAEYAPWSVPRPRAPVWANIAHVNTWLPPRFLPSGLALVSTLHHAIHDPALRKYKGRLRALYHDAWIAPIERRVIARSRCAVAVSSHASMVGAATLFQGGFDVIENGVDVEVFKPPRRTPGRRSAFKLLYVGGWSALKGVDLLPRLMTALGDGFELSYTGSSGDDRPSIAPGNMRDIGRLVGAAKVAEAMQSADALIVPSRSEGFGLVAAEAMACGLPVVAAAGTALDSVVCDGETGILCPRDDVAAFVDAIRSLARDEDGLERMRCASRRRAVEMFSLDQMVDRYLSCYRAVLGNIG